MSHQVRPSSSQSSSSHDVRGFHHAQSSIPTPQVSPTKLPAMIPADHRHQNQGGRGLPAPPPHAASERSPSAERSSRGLGVQALINPQSNESQEPRGRRRSAAQMESPSPVESVSAVSLPPLTRPNSRDYGEDEWPVPPGAAPRRILSPRSPRLNRTRSMGILGAPTGSIDAHQQPFPGAAGPGPLQAPAPSIRGTYYHPATAPTPPPMLMPGGHRRASAGMVPSGSVSPTTSFSSVAQPGQSPATSLMQHSGNTPLQTPGQTPPTMHIGLAHSAPPGGLSLPGPAHPVDDRPPMVGIPVVSTHSSNYQIFTVNTRQGHQVTIPVDVQAASRVADEKRRRNAGASARFRARRKEKEREASALISKLEQQVVDANEDVDFYRRERDALADLLFNTPGGAAHFPRPQSPRRRRPSVASSGMGPSSTTGSNESVSGAPPASASVSSDRPERSEGDRNVRRRTSAYLPPISSTASAQASPATGPSHGGPTGNLNFPGLGPPAGPMHEDLSSRQHPGPPTAQPSPQRPGAHNMFVERFDRSWPPGSGPPNGGDHRRQ